MSDDELVETLVRLGEGPTPPPDPAFANRLDAHLRALRTDHPARWGQRSVLGLALAGLAGVVVAIMVSLSFVGGEPAVVVMTAAADTDVVLPGQAATPGVVGQRLPDGTRIVVNLDGEAVVGGVVLDSGTEALVVAGRIEVLSGDDQGDAAPTTRPVLRPEFGDTPATGSTQDRSDGSGSSTTSAQPQSTDRPTTATVDRPATSPTTATGGDRPVTTPTTTDTRRTTSTVPPTTARPTTTSTRGTDQTTTRPRSEPSIDVTVEARASDRILLEWELAGASDPDGWRIEAVSGDRVMTLVVLRDGTARMATVSRIDARRVGFRVVALDASGSAVLASEVVRQPAP